MYPYDMESNISYLCVSNIFNCDKLIYFKGVEYIQRAWRKILLQRKEIKDHFKDQVARELMAYCYHPSRLSFQV